MLISSDYVYYTKLFSNIIYIMIYIIILFVGDLVFIRPVFETV